MISQANKAIRLLRPVMLGTLFFSYSVCASQNSEIPVAEVFEETVEQTAEQIPQQHTEEKSAPNSDSIYQEPKASLAIIIDDIGYSRVKGLRAANIPVAITLAVLPHSPNGKMIAEQAHSQNKELMLHIPMESENFGRLDAGGLYSELEKEQFLEVLNKSLDSIPHIKGVNNHMGSYLTQQAEPMSWLMDVLAERELYFIDSKTHPDSVAEQTAKHHHVPTNHRHIFLDNELEVQNINKQFNKALRIANSHGYAIAIGHPHEETLDYLEKVTPLLKDSNIHIVPASKLIPEYRAKYDVAASNTAE